MAFSATDTGLSENVTLVKLHIFLRRLRIKMFQKQKIYLAEKNF
jgi:hypothetical protein